MHFYMDTIKIDLQLKFIYANRMIHAFVIASCLFFSLNSELFGQTVIDQDHTGTSNEFFSVDEFSNVGQSFIVNINGGLQYINADIEAQICPFNPSLDSLIIIYNLREGDGLNGDILYSNSTVLDLPVTRGLHQFNIEELISVVQGQTLTFELKTADDQICDIDPGIPLNFVWYNSGSNTYMHGQSYSPGIGNLPNDMYFQSWVDPSVSTGKELEFFSSFPVFPNPVNESAYYSAELMIRQIDIIDQLGNIKSLNWGNGFINFRNINPGVYVLRATLNENEIRMNRIIIQR